MLTSFLVLGFYGYFVIGGAFGLWFVLHGAGKLDAGMIGASKALRALIFPGSVLLWPVLLKKTIRTNKPKP